MKKNLQLLFILSALLMVFSGCQKSENKPSETEIKIGTIAGPETDLMRIAAAVAKTQYNLDIQIVEFEDYVMPNVALNDGTIDANMFQHEAYFNESIKQREYPLTEIGKTFVYPMGLYSKKIRDLQDLTLGSKVAVPNDPSNEERALLLLEHSGLIHFTDPEHPSLKEISDNPKQLNVIEMDAAQLPRALEDVALAAINTNYAIPAGLLPKQDALFLENQNSPYVNIVAVRTSEKDLPKFKQLMEALHSRDVVVKAEELFKDQAIVGW